MNNSINRNEKDKANHIPVPNLIVTWSGIRLNINKSSNNLLALAGVKM